MLTIVPSKRFLKAAKKYRTGGKRYVLTALEEVVHLLSMYDVESQTTLRTVWRDHLLKGDKRGIRELHVSMDDLLLYRVDEVFESIELLDIVNHEELRKQR